LRLSDKQFALNMQDGTAAARATLEFIEHNPSAFTLPANKAVFGFDDLGEAQQLARGDFFLGYDSESIGMIPELTFLRSYRMQKVYDTSGYQQIMQDYGGKLEDGTITSEDWDEIVTLASRTCAAQASGTVVIFVDASDSPDAYPKTLTDIVLRELRTNNKAKKILYLTGVCADTTPYRADPRHPDTVFLEAREPDIRSRTTYQDWSGEPWNYTQWSTQQASAEQFQSTIEQLRHGFISHRTRLSPAGAKAPFQLICSIIEAICSEQHTGKLVPALTGPLNFAAWTVALDLVDTFSERINKPNARPTAKASDAVKLLLDRLDSTQRLALEPSCSGTYFAMVPTDQVKGLMTRFSDINQFFAQRKTAPNLRFGHARSAPAPTPSATLAGTRTRFSEFGRDLQTQIANFRQQTGERPARRRRGAPRA
jgi:hypothetical protein